MSGLGNAFRWMVVTGIPLIMFVGGYITAPVLLVWSWARWVRRTRQWTPCAILSFAGLAVATVSALIAVTAMVYSISIGGEFPHHFNDPLFMKVFWCGGLLSRIGIVLGICGVWQPSSIRWHALACAAGV